MNFVLSKIIHNSRCNTVVIPALFKAVLDINNGSNQQNITSDQQSFPMCNIHFPHKVICVPNLGFKFLKQKLKTMLLQNLVGKNCIVENVKVENASMETSRAGN